MTDVFSPQKRSRVMQAIRSAGNKSTELRLIRIFKEHSVKGWRRNIKITGSPDFVFKKYKIAVFSDGCFWHGHKCRKLWPQTNAEFWRNKISRNKKRDKLVNKELKAKGWRVVRFWECELGAKSVRPQIRLLQNMLSCAK
ncbi:MAG: very short patch repair endonuclease [Nitrospinae bacterium]|nr:very short patch repair endonuclease [Nitrospinota bacterium]